jgi:hypothetical protein
MDNFNIAIIKPNKFKFSQDDLESLTVDKILDDIQNHIDIVSLSSADFMEKIVTTIGLKPELMGDTNICYEDNKYIYQISHLDLKKNNLLENDNINGIASYLPIDDINVHGNAIFLCSEITDNHTCITNNVNLNIIAEILYNKIVKTGIKISTDGNITEFKYSNDPIENMNQDEKNNLRWLECNILKFNLILFVQKNPNPNTINKKGTKLFGTHRVYGNVYVVEKVTDNKFSSLQKTTFTKLLEICNGPLNSRDLIENENKDGQKINNLPIVYNRYCLLNDRYKNRLNKCNNCSKELNNDDFFKCAGCYRINYDSKECQKEDWTYHKPNCLNIDKNLNKLLK